VVAGVTDGDGSNGNGGGSGLDLWMGRDLVAHPMDLRFDGEWIHEEQWPPAEREEQCYCLDQAAGAGSGALVAVSTNDRANVRGGNRQVETTDSADGAVFEHCSPLECGLGAGEWCPRDGGGEGPEFQADQRCAKRPLGIVSPSMTDVYLLRHALDKHQQQTTFRQSENA
jgi:hypothetical protein